MLSFKSLGLDLRITPSLSLPRATLIPPGRAKKAVTSDVGPSKFDFLAFQKIPSNLNRKNDENSKIRDRLRDVRGSFSDRFGAIFEKSEIQNSICLTGFRDYYYYYYYYYIF